MLDPDWGKSNRYPMGLKYRKIDSLTAWLFAVRNPDVLNLRSMLEKPASLSQIGVEPVDLAAVVGPDLFQISRGHGFGSDRAGFISEAPDGVHIVVLGENFQQL